MPAPRPPAFDTLSLHAGQRPDPATGARAVPIYETTSYVFDDADHAARAVQSRKRRPSLHAASPTRRRRCWRSASPRWRAASARSHRERHGGAASGHRDARRRGRPHRRLVLALRRHDQPADADAAALRHSHDPRQAARPRRLRRRDPAARPGSCIGETIGNPGLEVLDIPAVAEHRARRAACRSLIDNTFATPYLSRPIELGADIVMHSLTKWIGGHGLVIGGALVDGGRFDWLASGRHPDADRALRRLSRPQLRRAFRPVGVRHARARPRACATSAPACRRTTPRGC